MKPTAQEAGKMADDAVPLPKALTAHNFAGVHPARFPKDVASAVAEGSIDMATVVAAGVWPPRPKSQLQPLVHPAATTLSSPVLERTAPSNPYMDTLASSSGTTAAKSTVSPKVRSTASQATSPPEATAAEPAFREAMTPREAQLAASPDHIVEEHDPSHPIAPATTAPKLLPLDAAGRRNPLLAWKVQELQREADNLQAQLGTERQEREDVLRRDGVEIGSLEARTQNENADLQRESGEIQEWKHRVSALEVRLNESQAQRQKEKLDSTASFHRLENLFHQLERQAKTVQSQEQWDRQEVQQLQSKALKEKKHAASSEHAQLQLQTRLRESASNLSKALAVATAEKKKTVALTAWKDKASKAIISQGQRLKAETALEQKMKLLLAREKNNDHDRDEKMYALELRLQKAESEKRVLQKKVQEQANRVAQLEAGDDVNFDDDEHVMVQASSKDESNSLTTTTEEPTFDQVYRNGDKHTIDQAKGPAFDDKAAAPVLSSWARLIPQNTLPPAKVMNLDSTVAGVPQEIRQSSALWNLWKQSTI